MLAMEFHYVYYISSIDFNPSKDNSTKVKAFRALQLSIDQQIKKFYTAIKGFVLLYSIFVNVNAK